jgi:Tfp pilus assembly protein PilX
MLGITAMNMSNLELKMATNTQEKASSLQQSEFALNESGATVDTVADALNTGGTFPSGSGYYDMSGGAAIPPDVNKSSFWKNSVNFISNGADGGYVVEYLGKDNVINPEDRFDPSATPYPVFVFRVTAHGSGAVSASTLLQMMYLRINATGT